MSDSLQPHESQHTRPPCPSPTPRVHSLSHPSSHLILCRPLLLLPPALPASKYFPMSQLFAWGGQSTGVWASTSVLSMNTQDWSLRWTGWISLQSNGLPRVFSNTTAQKHQFFSTQLSSQSNSHIHTAFFIVQLSHDHWKNHSLDWMDFCWQSNVYFLICCLGWSQLSLQGVSVF